MALVELNSLKSRLDIDLGKTKDDRLLGEILSACEARIERHCKQPLKSTTVTTPFGGTGKPYKILKYRPVSAITEVRAGRRLDQLSLLTLSAFYVGMQSGAYALFNDSGSFDSSLTYMVKLTVGPSELPAEVGDVILEMAALKFERLKRLGVVSIGKSTGSTGSSTTTYGDEPLKKEWIETLKPYRIISIG